MAAKSTKKKKNTRGTTKKNQENTVLRSEILILGMLAVCIFLLISNFGLGGLIGDILSALMFGIFGWMAYLIPVLIFGITAFLISNKGNKHAYIKAVAAIVFVIVATAILELVVNSYHPGTELMEYYRQASIGKEAGGLLGGVMITILCPAIGVAGTYIVLILLMIICIILITEKSLLKPLGQRSKRIYDDARTRRQSAVERSAREKKETKEKKEQPEKRNESKKISGVSFATTLGDAHSKRKSPDVQELNILEEEPLPPLFDEEIIQDPEEEPEFVIQRSEPLQMEESISDKSSHKKADEPIQRPEDVEREIQKQEGIQPKEYRVPPISLLKRGKKGGGNSDRQLRETALKLEQTLQNFGVKVHVTNASCGPSVTRYELQPEQGVKVSKIVGLADDIKLNLAVTDLRIEAPIPGKAAVGIEVPNSENSAVMLRDLLESKEFQQSSSKITFAVGKDIAGKVVVADIAKMPHLLVAGSTGSGKSVCINTLIMSILYKSNPEDVKLIMVDPKVVELSVYNGIPHLLIPVVTDPRKAAGALNWAVSEMMKRYQLFAEYNVRDLTGFNEKVLEMKGEENAPKKMPQIVIIVDELADLMMVAPKDVESAICRLAQLARAAGLHLILESLLDSKKITSVNPKGNQP